MDKIIEKLKRLFAERFPGSVAELEQPTYSEKVGGSLIWSGFEDVEQLDRQRQISCAIREAFTPEERHQVGVIFSFTPEEVAVMREG